MIPWWTLPVVVGVLVAAAVLFRNERRVYRLANPRPGALEFDTPGARRALADRTVLVPLPPPAVALGVDDSPGYGPDDWFGDHAA